MNKSPLGVGFVLLMLVLAQPHLAFAATTPSLGMASTFGILGSTYTNTAAGTTINGDLGYTTGPAMAPTVSGTTHVADATYNQAGVDQASALSGLNAQPCDFNFGSPTDLSLLTQPLTPGVYCFSAAASIGTSGITLNGAGTYIFRVNGALTTVANSNVSMTNGATACNVFWTPTAATTLGANSSFAGTVISAPGITVGSTVTWVGRALAFGGTVTTDLDTITVPSCLVPPVVIPPAVVLPSTITVVKTVINDDGRTNVVADFALFANGTPVVSGATNSFPAGVYVVSEISNSNYTQTFSGDCDINGQLILASGNNKTCNITNNDIAVAGSIGSGGTPVVQPVTSTTLPITGLTLGNILTLAGISLIVLVSMTAVLRKCRI